MPKLNDLQEQKNKHASEIQELRNKYNDQGEKWLDAEQRAAWEKVNDDYNSVKAEMDKAREAEDVARRADEIAEEQKRSTAPKGTVPPGREDSVPKKRGEHKHNRTDDYNMALHAWCRHQAGVEVPENQLDACKRLRFSPARKEFPVDLLADAVFEREQATYYVTHPNKQRELQYRNMATDGSAGNTIPQGFVPRLEQAMLAYGGMMQVAEVMRTNTGNALPWPNVDDTGNSGQQVDEAASVDGSVDPAFNKITLNAYKFTSNMVKLSIEILEDSAFDLVSYLSQALGVRIGRILNSKFTNGSGTDTPNGIVTASSLGVTAASATAFTADEILQLIHSVDPSYRMGARFMMHDAINLQVQLLKDGDGNYLWRSGLELGKPDTIRGYGLTINQDMDSAVTTGKKTMLFGDLKKYKIRLIRQIRLRRLVERYADTDEEAFVAFIRGDGDLQDAGTGPVKRLQQA